MTSTHPFKASVRAFSGRRAWLQAAAALPSLALPPMANGAGRAVASGSADPHRALAFPADFGAHPDSRIEWWYITGALDVPADAGETCGFQITFFRARTGVPADQPSRFAAQQLVFAHAALTELKTDRNAGRLRHDQRIARAGFGIAGAAVGDTAVTLRGWQLARSGPAGRSRYHARLASESAGFAFDFSFDSTQPPLLQGEAGYSQKGPAGAAAGTAAGEPPFSRYYSQPQLAVSGSLSRAGRAQPVRGTAWLDHEWSDAYLAADAVGWDWIGFNLEGGSALTAFRLRRADGSALWAGGSFRAAPSGNAATPPARNFAADAVRFTPGRIWQSPASKARYPVEWQVDTPAGRFSVRTLLDDQELDSRNSTGAIYWEGLSELFDASGRRVGRGYLEMTGYAAALSL